MEGECKNWAGLSPGGIQAQLDANSINTT